MIRRHLSFQIAAVAGLASALAGPSTAIGHGFAHARAFSGAGAHAATHAHSAQDELQGLYHSAYSAGLQGPAVTGPGEDDHKHLDVEVGPVQKVLKGIALPAPATIAVFATEIEPLGESLPTSDIRSRGPPDSPPPRLRAPPRR